MARTRNIYDPRSSEPYKVSRSKIELFLRCPRCFVLDRRHGVDEPSGPPFTLNIAVDELLKREFDLYRAQGKPHPLMVREGIDAVPYRHPDLEAWRSNFRGIEFLHRETNLLITGALDDVWIEPEGTLIVVDYKATSTDRAITLEDDWKKSYKRQIEIYQWLLRRNGFAVSDIGYFVYVNAQKQRESFDGKLEFDMHLLSYMGNDDWVEDAIREVHRTLTSDDLPPPTATCALCAYRKMAGEVEQ